MKIRKFNKAMPDLQHNDRGDWVDLYSVTATATENTEKAISEAKAKDFEVLEYVKGDVVICGLGVAMELPECYEAEIRPRSSTFKVTGLLLTNSPGTIDNSYRGNNDEWKAMFYATRDGKITKFQRLLQFRIQKKMDKIIFKYVDELTGENRGGYGTSGK